jgi:calcineurin-like phosphoesterase family protein
MHWFTADTHFLDTDMKRHNRPFRSPEEGFVNIINNINSRVKKDDILWHLGDVYLSDYHDDARRYLSKIKCKNMILVKGNHDEDENRLRTLKPFFRKVLDEWEGKIEGIDIYMNHIPSKCPKSKFSLTGHIHDAWKIRKNLINVGVDVHHYRPVSIEDIMLYKDKMKNNIFDNETYIS